MICVAVNNMVSYNNISKWKDEIYSTITDVPIVLVQTKKDLEPYVIDAGEEPVTKEKLDKTKLELNLVGVQMTSSKEWEDFNVHKAFVYAITAGIEAKYKL